MMCAVSDTNLSEGSTRAPQNDGGVLANLPRTRPQRATARRTAARSAGASSGARARKTSDSKRSRSSTAVKSPRKRTSKPAEPGRAAKAASTARARAQPPLARAKAPSTKARRAATAPVAARRRSAPPEEAAPRQGFESDGESDGGSLQPPGGAEFVASAAEIVGELAKAGLSRSERLLKDVFSRLPGA
jgi:hypothetical protein